MTSTSTALAVPPKRRRAAVTTGRRAFINGDGNSPWARRHRDVAEFILDGLGPLTDLSEAQIGLARRAATITCQLEAMEGRASLGEEIDLDKFARATGTLTRIHKALGLKRVARDAGPSNLIEHLAAKRLAASS